MVKLITVSSLLVGLLVAVVSYQLLSYQDNGIAYIIEINRPVQEVFAAVVNPEQQKLWVSGLIQNQPGQGRLVPGLAIEREMRVGKENEELHDKVEELIPNDSLVMATTVKEGYEALSTYTFYPTGRGTRVEFVQDIVYLNNVGKVLAPFLVRSAQHKIEKDLHRLKKILERGE